jgi:two-component system phosphate regulon sensor histidine kinase PhoR
MNENQEQNIEKIREDFVANASHELKTPITSIQLAAETALNAINDGNTEDGLKFIKQILRNSERMSLLISDLLDLSKIEQNEPNLEIADLENIVNMEISYLKENDQARLNANIENIHINVDQQYF